MKYIFRKKELIEQLKDVEDDDFIMIQIGGHTGSFYPITHVEDSQHVGFWEIRCDLGANFWDEIKKVEENNEL